MLPQIRPLLYSTTLGILISFMSCTDENPAATDTSEHESSSIDAEESSDTDESSEESSTESSSEDVSSSSFASPAPEESSEELVSSSELVSSVISSSENMSSSSEISSSTEQSSMESSSSSMPLSSSSSSFIEDIDVCDQPDAFPTSNAWKFVSTSDSRGGDGGVNKDVLEKIRDGIIAEGDIELVIYPGDMVNDGYTDQYDTFDDSFTNGIEAAGIRFYVVAGNHEYHGPDSDFNRYKERNQEIDPDSDGRTISISHENVLFYGIDWENQGLELDKLKEDVATHQPKHIIGYAHAPLWKVNHSGKYDEEPRDTFINYLTDNGGYAFFAGHDHFYSHSTVNENGKDFHQFIVGTAGAPFYDNGSFGRDDAENVLFEKMNGYAVGTIDGRFIQIEFKKLVGDSFEVVDVASWCVD